MAGCAPAYMPGIVPNTRLSVPEKQTSRFEVTQPITVETHTYPYSPTVSVVGWSEDEDGIGLRTTVRRDGTAATYHRLYVSAFYPPSGPVFSRAMASSGPVALTGVTRDVHSCDGGKCMPYTTFGARISDAQLRAHRDSVSVTFYARDGREMAIVVRRELIDAYLGVVDSVSAILRKK